MERDHWAPPEKELTLQIPLDFSPSSCYHGFMNTGRRSFFKTLGAIVGGLAVSRQVRAMEQAKASQYIRKFRENSVPQKPISYKGWSGIATSGCFCVTGLVPAVCVSGYYGEDPTRQKEE